MLPSQLLLTQGGTTVPPEQKAWAAGRLPIEEGFGGANRASTQCTPLPGAKGGGLTLSLSVSNTEAAHGTQWAGAGLLGTGRSHSGHDCSWVGK